MDSVEQTYRPLLEALSFAGRAHQGQLRKDGRTPYASHPSRVCLVLAHVFGIHDPTALMAGALHDTIEDTTTDYDDLNKRFGPEVARWVALLSKDPRLEEDERERLYREQLAAAPWQVKVCKLADIFDNTLDSRHFSPEGIRRTLRKSRGYLDALNTPDLPDAARRVHDLVSRLLDEMESRTV
jgi:guanosine-3',5'-bis(diphosphate) 3'-pyrophosphohydrolase